MQAEGDNLRMSFKTTLFKALEVAATVHCNGHQVVSKMLDQTPEALLKPYVDLDNGATLYIHDAEILIDTRAAPTAQRRRQIPSRSSGASRSSARLPRTTFPPSIGRRSTWRKWSAASRQFVRDAPRRHRFSR